MELGIYTFVEVPIDTETGSPIGTEERIRHLLEEMELADHVGLDVFAVGEHHRPDYASSAPAVILAAGAARTRRIRLSSAVSVLSSDDPVRVFQDFATLDLLSGGRAEIMAGRGSFIESFPLFGYDLDQYDELFAEKLDLLLALRESERVTWEGRLRPPIRGQGVYPRPVQDPIPVWIAVGGTPQSVARAATLGLPLALAIIGGVPERFAPLMRLYREVAERAGHDPSSLPVSLNMHGFIATDANRASEVLFPPYAAVMSRIGRERGWPPTTREDFDRSIGLHGPVVVGDPEAVTEKILHLHRVFGNQRFMLQLTVGPTPHEDVLRAIELFGNEVAPAVRAELGSAVR
jgi:probable LLM family oxidoreductase